ncbi:MFS transporter, partial [Actinomycetota bacterium]
LLGLGAGAAMAPSTANVMEALPTSKAGIGSALNDTSREVGAVLGIAILGSVASFIYRANIADTLTGAPEGMAETVKSSAGAGLAVARDIGGIAGTALQDAVATGFSRGVAVAFALSAGLTAITAVTVAVSSHRETAKAPRQSPTEHQALAA